VVGNPATGAQLGSVPDFGAVETEAAIVAAHAALPAWSARTARNVRSCCAACTN
jgi:succinate-semialdehyde dehydrogenase/glutarate-semialdehyde dehydrogenase